MQRLAVIASGQGFTSLRAGKALRQRAGKALRQRAGKALRHCEAA